MSTRLGHPRRSASGERRPSNNRIASPMNWPTGLVLRERMIRWPCHRQDRAGDDAPLDQRNTFPGERGERADDRGTGDHLIALAVIDQVRSIGGVQQRHHAYAVLDPRYRDWPQPPNHEIRTPLASCNCIPAPTAAMITSRGDDAPHAHVGAGPRGAAHASHPQTRRTHEHQRPSRTRQEPPSDAHHTVYCRVPHIPLDSSFADGATPPSASSRHHGLSCTLAMPQWSRCSVILIRPISEGCVCAVWWAG